MLISCYAHSWQNIFKLIKNCLSIFIGASVGSSFFSLSRKKNSYNLGKVSQKARETLGLRNHWAYLRIFGYFLKNSWKQDWCCVYVQWIKCWVFIKFRAIIYGDWSAKEIRTISGIRRVFQRSRFLWKKKTFKSWLIPVASTGRRKFRRRKFLGVSKSRNFVLLLIGAFCNNCYRDTLFSLRPQASHWMIHILQTLRLSSEGFSRRLKNAPFEFSIVFTVSSKKKVSD